MKIKLDDFSKNNKPINANIITGIKNGYYISRNLKTNGYRTVDKSFYFFHGIKIK